MNYYVTHFDQKTSIHAYRLFETLKLNSKLKIIAFCVNFDPDLSNFDNVIPVKINSKNLKAFNLAEYSDAIKLIKPYLCLTLLQNKENWYNQFCYLDSDTLALNDCDDIFSNVADGYPLFPKLPSNTPDSIHHENKVIVSNLNDLLHFNYETSKHRIYKTTNMFLFNSSCFLFMEKFSEFCLNKTLLQNPKKYTFRYEDDIINGMFFHYGYKKYLPDTTCMHFPRLNFHFNQQENGKIRVSGRAFANFCAPFFDHIDLDSFVRLLKTPRENHVFMDWNTKLPSIYEIKNLKFFHGKLSKEEFDFLKPNFINQNDQNDLL